MIRLIEVKLSSDSTLTIPEAYSVIYDLYPDVTQVIIERNNGDEDTVRVSDDRANESEIVSAVIEALNQAAYAKATKQ